MLVWFKTLSIGIQLAIVAVFIGVLVGSVWLVYHSIWQAGYDAAVAKLQPRITELEGQVKQRTTELVDATEVNKTFSAENARLAILTTEQSNKVLKLEADGIRAQNDLRVTLAKLRDSTRLNTQQRATITRLEQIVNGPPMTEKDCETADSIMRDLLRDRMPDGVGNTPAANQPRADHDHGGGTSRQAVPG